MKLNIKSKVWKSHLLLLRSRYLLRSFAPILPHIPREISYIEDLLGDG